MERQYSSEIGEMASSLVDSNQEIKNCPFCGEAPEIFHNSSNCGVWCSCDVGKKENLGTRSREEALYEAIKGWNERA